MEESVSSLAVLGKIPPKLINPNNPPPVWEEDGFDSFLDYEKHYCRLGKSLFKESTSALWKKKAKWDRGEKLMELQHILDELLEKHPTKTRMPMLPQMIEEYVSTRNSETARPQAQSRQPAMDQFVGYLNYFKDVELDENPWDSIQLKKGLDQLQCRIAFERVDVDTDCPGPFGHPGKHTISLVDPRMVWPDPYAASWQWEDMRYLIIAKPMDLAEIQKTWPDRGRLVIADEDFSSIESEDKGSERKTIESLLKSPTGHMIGKRERALVLEIYLKDTRTRAIDVAAGIEGGEGRDIAPKMVPRYPGGRLLIMCGDVLLRDSANPFDHGRPPIVAFPEGPYKGLFSYSPIEALNVIERKIDLLLRESYQSFRTHLNNQWVIDRNAFTKPSQYENISQDPRQVFVVRPGSRVMRLPPGEVPASLFEFLDQLYGFLDDFIGISEINRGSLQKGSQLAADSVAQLQGAGMTRMKMKTKMDLDATVEVGKLLFSNIKQFYPPKLKIEAKDPSGNPLNIDWDKNKWQNNWVMSVQAGSNTPGSKLSALQQALVLFDRGIVDEEYVLAVASIAGAGDILKRIKEEKEKLASMGFIKEAMGIKKRSGPNQKEPHV